ncbi:MAG: hypothetical protein AB8G99_24220 [Planctomycetaceae bacterium]
MSRQSYKTPTPDIYTALLFIGTAAMLAAVLFLWWALGSYDYQVAA